MVGIEQIVGIRHFFVRPASLSENVSQVTGGPSHEKKRTNISEPPGTYELSRGYLVSSLLLPSSSGTESHPIQEGIQHLLGLKSRFAGFNLLVFVPRFSKSAHGPEGSWELSYEATKLSNNGGGNPIVSRTLTSEERKGGAMSNGIDGKGGDEWPKVKDATKSLRELLTRDGAELKEGSSSGGKPDEELAEELFHILSQWADLAIHPRANGWADRFDQQMPPQRP